MAQNLKRQRVIIHAAGVVLFTLGVPAYRWFSGTLTGVITDTGVGDVSLNFNALDGVDATECICLITHCASTGFPLRTASCCIHTSDIAKQILIASEQAGGAAAAAQDEDFEFCFLKLDIL